VHWCRTQGNTGGEPARWCRFVGSVRADLASLCCTKLQRALGCWPQVHALNCLRGAFTESSIAVDVSGCVASGAETAILGMASPHWQVRLVAASLIDAGLAWHAQDCTQAALGTLLRLLVQRRPSSPLSPPAQRMHTLPPFRTPVTHAQVRNAASLTFTALLVRLVGRRNADGGATAKRAPTAAEFFHRCPPPEAPPGMLSCLTPASLYNDEWC